LFVEVFNREAEADGAEDASHARAVLTENDTNTKFLVIVVVKVEAGGVMFVKFVEDSGGGRAFLVCVVVYFLSIDFVETVHHVVGDDCVFV